LKRLLQVALLLAMLDDDTVVSYVCFEGTNGYSGAFLVVGWSRRMSSVRIAWFGVIHGCFLLNVFSWIVSHSGTRIHFLHSVLPS
jgi:hypothetical protein